MKPIPRLRPPIVPDKQDGPLVGTRVIGPFSLEADGHTPISPVDPTTMSAGIVQAVDGKHPDTRLAIRCLGADRKLLTNQSGMQWAPVDVHSAIEVRLIGERGWVFTVGLEHLELPELEIRACPTFLMREAGLLLNHIARFMSMTGRVLEHGDSLKLGTGGGTSLQRFLQLDPLPDDDLQFYQTTRLCIVEDPRMAGLCASCGNFHDGATHVH